MFKTKFVIIAALVLLTVGCQTVDLENNVWINLYDKETTLENIIELRGMPFDVNTTDGSTELIVYYYTERESSSFETVVPIIRETVRFDSNGGFIDAQGYPREHIISTPASFYKLLVDPVLNNMVEVRSQEMLRVENFIQTTGLTFSKREWKRARWLHNWWLKSS